MNEQTTHPDHYHSRGRTECIDLIKGVTGELYPGFLIGNIIKYLYRYKDKGGDGDLQKAENYIKYLRAEEKDD